MASSNIAFDYGKIRKLPNHPSKRMFPNNLHHKNQILLFGSEVQKHNQLLGADNQFQSEYKRTYEESLKKLHEERSHRNSARSPAGKP